MKHLTRFALLTLALFSQLFVPWQSFAADHNDPNSVNSIFSDIKINPADLYDLFGWPSDDTAGGEKVIVALTFAAVPVAGTLDPDFLYRIRIAPTPRNSPNLDEDTSLDVMLKYFDAVKDKYARLNPSDIRVTVDKAGHATITFANLPGGDFSKTIDTNTVVPVTAPDGSVVKVYIGGRDDAFFNDLPGFFRSINYAPEYYHVPHDKPELRELKIPMTLLELEGNTLFNFDPAHPDYGYDQSTKRDLPQGPLTWNGNRFAKDKDGNYRFVYSGKDAQAGKNINAVILEMPVKLLTRTPDTDRIINAWGESWVMKASHKVDTIPDDRPPLPGPFWFRHPWILPLLVIIIAGVLLYFGLRSLLPKAAAADAAQPKRPVKWWPILETGLGLILLLLGFYAGSVLSSIASKKPALTLTPAELGEQLSHYKLIDTDGLPFADAALNEREDNRQLGADNFWLAPHFVTRLAHLGWGFGPSISALGLKTSFDHSNSPVSVYKVYSNAEILDAFTRAKKVVFQRLNMPDNKWNKKGLPIPLKRPIEIFIPNVCAIDMDTTGTWPFGRRPEDQVATRFLSLFLDMSAQINGKPYNVDTLGDQALWDSAPIVPKTPPNPLKNDKEFLDHFPYLADPWPQTPEYGYGAK